MSTWMQGRSAAAFALPGSPDMQLRTGTAAEVVLPSSLQQLPSSPSPSPRGETRPLQASLPACGVVATVAALSAGRRKRKSQKAEKAEKVALGFKVSGASTFAGATTLSPLGQPHSIQQGFCSRSGQRAVCLSATLDPETVQRMAEQMADPAQAAAVGAAAAQAAAEIPRTLVELLGPPLPAAAFDAKESASNAWSSVANFFFDPALQWDANGDMLLDPRGEAMPDNLWTQFVACQATLIKRLNEGLEAAGVPQSFGFAVMLYTLCIRAFLYPFVKGQLETTAKIQVLAPRVNEIKAKYKDDEERMQQEVGLLYMDLQVDPLGAVFPLLLQLPVFWGLYRALRRLAIVEYPALQKGWLWIPSLYGPNFEPDPSFKWLSNWNGPLIQLAPKIGWTDFALYSALPVGIALAYREVLKEALSDESSPKFLQFFPFLLAFITAELPQALGIYLATNIVSSVALTAVTKNQISSKIPGYEDFVKTGEWPEGVDPEKVLADAFGVEPLVGQGNVQEEEPQTVPEAVFANRVDIIPKLLEQGKSIDEFDNRGIQASAYTIALDNEQLLERLLKLGADPLIQDKKGNSLLHYAAGYGRAGFVTYLLDMEAGKLKNTANEDGQTPLDVARMNLSQENVSESVRGVITVLTERGAEGKTTTEADEARFEEALKQKLIKKEADNARSMLKAMAMAAQQQADNAAKQQQADKAAEPAATAEAEKADSAEEATPAGAPRLLQNSLDRVKALDVESLRSRLGDKLSDEQLEKLSKRLSAMSPEDLAAYMAGLPSVQTAPKEEAKEEAKEAAPPAQTPEKRTSVLVD